MLYRAKFAVPSEINQSTLIQCGRNIQCLHVKTFGAWSKQ